MAAELGFSLEIEATSLLSLDADRVEALITVTASPTGKAAPAAHAAEILIMDKSASMRGPKIHHAMNAACAAIDVLPHGVLLGIIGGNETVERVFPAVGGLVRVDADAKEAAKQRVMSLWASGTTKIGAWLTEADRFFATGPASGVIRHAVLYSDGKDVDESREQLDNALRDCEKTFVCDVRGVGDGDWDYAQLLHIAERLGGEAKAVTDVADLADDMTACIRRAARLVVPQAYLRLRPDRRFGIESILQTLPVQAELERSRWQDSASGTDVPLGPWERGTRCYKLTLSFRPDSLPVGDDLRATPVELVVETAEGTLELRADAALVVRRHELRGGVTARPERLTQFAKAIELTAFIQECADAWLAGRLSVADDALNRAIQLATQLGDDVRLRLLDTVATRHPDGRARLRDDVSRGDLLRLGMHSTRTGVPSAHAEDPPPISGHSCARCGEMTYAADPTYCENCRAPFNEDEGALP
jgi:Ca-activated chloride channel family protein